MIELKNIKRTYKMGTEEVQALKGVSLTVEDGEYVAIMGSSGSGKSTLMNIIGCLDRPSSGQYSIDNQPVQALSEDELAGIRNRKIGFVFQQFNLLPRMSALENVCLPLFYANVPPEESAERAGTALAQVGLSDRLHHRPNQLSGGQQQRVSIARALVNRPHLILADEPTGALDSRTSAEIMTLLEDLHSQGKTIIVVTHEPEVASCAKRLIKLKDGELVFDASTNAAQF
ncbi:MAG TPA: ABC transporter ATP-binding protein [Candidatus Obscuribacterales bacterium]